MSNFFGKLVDALKDEDTSILADGEAASEFTGFIDTGSYIMNAVTSGSIYGGIPNNKITGFAGESATGKTFFALGVVKAFLDQNPESAVIYYDSEAAVTRKMMEDRGIDAKRIIIAEPDTIQKFREHALKVLDNYMKAPESKRPPMMLVLDSLGMLSTTKEMQDSLDGKETKDMTKAQLIKAAFRVLTLKCARAKVPMLVTNHVYAGIGGLYPTNEIAGGSGMKYAASTIAVLSKRKEKEGTEVIGNVIHVKMFKSRLSKENAMVDVLLTYRNGLDRYYGLVPLALKYGIMTKVSTRIELPDGRKVFEKVMYRNPEEYFTKEILDQIDEAAKKEFLYGVGDDDGGPIESEMSEVDLLLEGEND